MGGTNCRASNILAPYSLCVASSLKLTLITDRESAGSANAFADSAYVCRVSYVANGSLVIKPGLMVDVIGPANLQNGYDMNIVSMGRGELEQLVSLWVSSSSSFSLDSSSDSSSDSNMA